MVARQPCRHHRRRPRRALRERHAGAVGRSGRRRHPRLAHPDGAGIGSRRRAGDHRRRPGARRAPQRPHELARSGDGCERTRDPPRGRDTDLRDARACGQGVHAHGALPAQPGAPDGDATFAGRGFRRGDERGGGGDPARPRRGPFDAHRAGSQGGSCRLRHAHRGDPHRHGPVPSGRSGDGARVPGGPQASFSRCDPQIGRRRRRARPGERLCRFRRGAHDAGTAVGSQARGQSGRLHGPANGTKAPLPRADRRDGH